MIISNQIKKFFPDVSVYDTASETFIYPGSKCCHAWMRRPQVTFALLINHNKPALMAFMLFILLSLFALSRPVSANTWPWSDSLNLINSSCPARSEQYQELNQLKMKITTAESVALAKEMALEPTEQAIAVLDNATTLVPYSDDLLSAKNRLSNARNRILLASSQAEVADEFSGMMLAGLDDDRAAQVKVGKTGCDYSTGEVIAIVIGLILGIIPGLILLVVLC